MAINAKVNSCKPGFIKVMTKQKAIHTDLLCIQTLVFDACKFKYSVAIAELESSEYGACSFELNQLAIRFRVSKITPTKIGQFVTLWKRNGKGPIEPFDRTDVLDLVIISARHETNFGHFIFPKSVLFEKGILSLNGKGGKRAIRVYPPWDIAINKQAQTTQKWQLNYFLDLSDEKEIDFNRAKILYGSV
jgi:hypothetical protein